MAGRPQRKARLAALARAAASPEPTRPRLTAEPLTIFREALALFRRAGLPWGTAKLPAREAALSVAPSAAEREQWDEALEATQGAWMRAYERRDTGSPLSA